MHRNITVFQCLVLSFLLPFCIINAQSSKKVIVENIAGAWCGLCPEAYVIMDGLTQNEQVIGLSLHVGDPMETSSTLLIGQEYTGEGVPAFLLDRYLFDNNIAVSYGLQAEEINESLTQRLASPAKMKIAFDTLVMNGTFLSFKINATFLENYGESDLRFNVYVVEKEVSSSESSYNQANFFNAVAGHPYNGLGNTIPNFVYKNVVRKMIGGAWGVPNSLDDDFIALGESFDYQYNLQLDADWDFDKLQLVALVQVYDEELSERNILNAEIVDVTEYLAEALLNQQNQDTTNQMTNSPDVGWEDYFGNSAQDDAQFKAVAYPNPTQNTISVDFQLPKNQEVQIELWDTNGKKLTTFLDSHLNAGLQQFRFDINAENIPGNIAFLRVKTEQGFWVEKLLF